MNRIHISRGLMHIYLFFEIAMKKFIRHIQLSQLPSTTHSNSQNQSHYCRLNNRTKGFMKVHTSLLMESFSYKSGLVPRDGTITIQFKLEHPFAANNQVNMWRSRNKRPGLLSLKSLKLSSHCLIPPRIEAIL